MKTSWILAVAILSAGVCQARLGETESQALARYGTPVKETVSPFDTNFVIRTYKKNDIDIEATFFVDHTGTNVIGRIRYTTPTELGAICLPEINTSYSNIARRLAFSRTTKRADTTNDLSSSSNTTTSSSDTNRVFHSLPPSPTYLLSSNTTAGVIMLQLLNANTNNQKWIAVETNKFSHFAIHYFRDNATANVSEHTLMLNLNEFSRVREANRKKQSEATKVMAEEKGKKIKANLEGF
jgi:hypothetical protein